MTWQAASFVVLAIVLLIGFGWYERRRPPARVVALVAVMAALAVVGRLAFAAIPNVKPTTDIVLFAGYALGPIPGFAVGAITALASNIFLGQGPWTPWQMVGWGACGVGGALLARAAGGRELGRVPLAIACGVAGLAFGAFMDVYQWTLAAQQDLATYIAISGTSLPYNLAHAFGNVVFCLLIGPLFIRSLTRYKRRFEVSWAAGRGMLPVAGGTAIAALVALSLLALPADRAGAARAGVSQAPTAHAAASTKRAATYLRGVQNRDGGFGAAAGQASSQLYTGWAALGLASAGHNPLDVRRGRGRTVVAYLRRSVGSYVKDVGSVQRTIMILTAAGVSPRSFGGRDLVAELQRRKLANGSISNFVSYTAFGILALKAARAPISSSSVSYLERSQNEDGGFGIAPGTTSDADMTGAVLQALAAAGRRSGGTVERAVGYLQRAQNSDGGFGATEALDSNSQSTGYAVQGLLAVRSAPGVVSGALAYLGRLQRSDGSISYSRTSRQTPVWVTGQAVMALRRKVLPLAKVPRKRRPARASAAVATGSEASADDREDRPKDAAASSEEGSASGTAAEPGETTLASRTPESGTGGSEAVEAAATSTSDDGGGPQTALVLGGLALLVVAGMLPWQRLRRGERQP